VDVRDTNTRIPVVFASGTSMRIEISPG